MIRREITLPQLGLIAGTRALFGAGLGLLLANHLAPEQRRAVGWTLLAVGALTTVPLAADVLLGHGSKPEPNGKMPHPEVKPRSEPEMSAAL